MKNIIGKKVQTVWTPSEKNDKKSFWKEVGLDHGKVGVVVDSTLEYGPIILLEEESYYHDGERVKEFVPGSWEEEGTAWKITEK